MTYLSEILADSPVGAWLLDETSGTIAADSSGNGLNGTYTGGYTLNSRTFTDGAKCVELNGSTGHVALGAPSALNFKDVWTLEAWGQTDIVGAGEQYLIGEGYNGTNVMWALCKNIGAGGTGKMMVGHYTGAWQTVTDPTNPVISQFHHFVGTWDGGSLRLYRDGTLVAGPTARTSVTSNEFNNIGLGVRTDPTPTGYWDGGIGRVAIYHSVLSESRILAHFQAGVGPAVARNFHQYAEVVIQEKARERLFHQYAEAVISTKAQERLFHQYAETLTRTAPPIRNYHQFAEILVCADQSHIVMGLHES